jgi:hypothetical protein
VTHDVHRRDAPALTGSGPLDTAPDTSTLKTIDSFPAEADDRVAAAS